MMKRGKTCPRCQKRRATVRFILGAVNLHICRNCAHYIVSVSANDDLTEEELDDLLDLLQRMVDGEPTNPDVQAWLPVLNKLKKMWQAYQ